MVGSLPERHSAWSPPGKIPKFLDAVANHHRNLGAEFLDWPIQPSQPLGTIRSTSPSRNPEIMAAKGGVTDKKRKASSSMKDSKTKKPKVEKKAAPPPEDDSDDFEDFSDSDDGGAMLVDEKEPAAARMPYDFRLIYDEEESFGGIMIDS